MGDLAVGKTCQVDNHVPLLFEFLGQPHTLFNHRQSPKKQILTFPSVNQGLAVPFANKYPKIFTDKKEKQTVLENHQVCTQQHSFNIGLYCYMVHSPYKHATCFIMSLLYTMSETYYKTELNLLKRFIATMNAQLLSVTLSFQTLALAQKKICDSFNKEKSCFRLIQR